MHPIESENVTGIEAIYQYITQTNGKQMSPKLHPGNAFFVNNNADYGYIVYVPFDDDDWEYTKSVQDKMFPDGFTDMLLDIILRHGGF